MLSTDFIEIELFGLFVVIFLLYIFLVESIGAEVGGVIGSECDYNIQGMEVGRVFI